MKKVLGTVSGFIAVSALVAGCGSDGSSSSSNGSSSGQKVTLTFMQNKTEAAGEFNKLIAEFEKQNPNITVQQMNPPNADTVLQTDLTKNQLPDVIATGADATFIEMAKGGVLQKFTGSSELSNVNSKYVQMLENETGGSDAYGVPYTVNAQPILYNKTLFKQYNLTIPTTWNELIADAQKIKAAGGTPFEFGFKDSWTTMVPWNSLAANLTGSDYISQLHSGKASFAKTYPQVLTQLQQLASYGESDEFGTDYNHANTNFANGKAVFYVQGDWAVAPIKQANPNVQLGSFVFPATNDASQTKLVSGIDSVLTISANTKHQAQATKFIDFLLEKQNAQTYSTSQALFSAVNGVTQQDPVVTNLETDINSGNITDYADHYYPAAMDANVSNMIQGFLVNKQAPSAFLTQLDSAYQKAYAQQ